MFLIKRPKVFHHVSHNYDQALFYNMNFILVKPDWSGDSRGNSFIGKRVVIPRPLIGRVGGTPSADQWQAASIFTSPDDADVDHGSKHKGGSEHLNLRHKVSHFVSESQSL